MVYKAGDKVKAVFQSACPRNNVRLESTFLTVERQDDEDAEQWEVVSTSSSPGNMPCLCPAPGMRCCWTCNAYKGFPGDARVSSS